MPPTTARGHLRGQHGTYEVPTLPDVLKALKQLEVAKRTAQFGRLARILHDIDLLLDLRNKMVREDR